MVLKETRKFMWGVIAGGLICTLTSPSGVSSASHARTRWSVVAEVQTEIAVLSVGEAVMRMDLADQAVMMFRNSTSGVLNVVYRRTDGHIGWIDPGD